jgi:hypothetical protein
MKHGCCSAKRAPVGWAVWLTTGHTSSRVDYVFHNDSIYVHSLLGRKIKALRANPHACLQVDDIRDEYNWRSAIAFGRYEEVTDKGERNWALRRLNSRFPHLTPVRVCSGARWPVFSHRLSNPHRRSHRRWRKADVILVVDVLRARNDVERVVRRLAGVRGVTNRIPSETCELNAEDCEKP